MLEVALIYLAVGALAGVLAGLFGIGGGAVIVPALAAAFSLSGVNEDIRMQLAIGTSLSTIVLTGAASVRAHHKLGNVSWPHVLRLLLGILVGTPVGAWVATGLSQNALERVFGIFLLLVALKMFSAWKPAEGEREVRPLLYPIAGSVIGVFSGLLGIGGGTLTVPFLTWSRLPMKRAVATSAACGLPIALSGTVSYAIAGQTAATQGQLPEWSVGFVYLPGFVLVAAASSMTARYGARWASLLPERRLRQAFGVLLVAVATKMLLP